MKVLKPISDERRQRICEMGTQALLWRLRCEVCRREGAWAVAAHCQRQARELERELVTMMTEDLK